MSLKYLWLIKVRGITLLKAQSLVCPTCVASVFKQECKQGALWLFVLSNLVIFYSCLSLALYPVNDA